MQFHQRKFLKRLFANTTHKIRTALNISFVAVNPVFQKQFLTAARQTIKRRVAINWFYRKGRHSHFYLYQQNFRSKQYLEAKLFVITDYRNIKNKRSIYYIQAEQLSEFLYFVSNHANDISIKQINNRSPRCGHKHLRFYT